jgi:hypothetical protein
MLWCAGDFCSLTLSHHFACAEDELALMVQFPQVVCPVAPALTDQQGRQRGSGRRLLEGIKHHPT